jgi:pimeloyl-ACP methyl ester carboxylesterase
MPSIQRGIWMTIVLCPGIHAPTVSQSFSTQLQQSWTNSFTEVPFPEPCLIFPTERYPAYSALHILWFLRQHLVPLSDPLILIGFSAGVVGAISTAWVWQSWGGRVSALIALDGWGVPLYGNFPIYRMSHDAFTHWSSAWLGSGESCFYADPPVGHLELWRSPQTIRGWEISAFSHHTRQETTAATFLTALIQRSIRNFVSYK